MVSLCHGQDQTVWSGWCARTLSLLKVFEWPSCPAIRQSGNILKTRRTRYERNCHSWIILPMCYRHGADGCHLDVRVCVLTDLIHANRMGLFVASSSCSQTHPTHYLWAKHCYSWSEKTKVSYQNCWCSCLCIDNGIVCARYHFNVLNNEKVIKTFKRINLGLSNDK